MPKESIGGAFSELLCPFPGLSHMLKIKCVNAALRSMIDSIRRLCDGRGIGGRGEGKRGLNSGSQSQENVITPVGRPNGSAGTSPVCERRGTSIGRTASKNMPATHAII